MAEQPWDALAYSVAYRMAVAASGIGHTAAVEHATRVAERAYYNEAIYLAARFAGCTDLEANAAARWDRH